MIKKVAKLSLITWLKLYIPALEAGYVHHLQQLIRQQGTIQAKVIGGNYDTMY